MEQFSDWERDFALEHNLMATVNSLLGNSYDSEAVERPVERIRITPTNYRSQGNAFSSLAALCITVLSTAIVVNADPNSPYNIYLGVTSAAGITIGLGYLANRLSNSIMDYSMKRHFDH